MLWEFWMEIWTHNMEIQPFSQKFWILLKKDKSSITIESNLKQCYSYQLDMLCSKVHINLLSQVLNSLVKSSFSIERDAILELLYTTMILLKHVK